MSDARFRIRLLLAWMVSLWGITATMASAAQVSPPLTSSIEVDSKISFYKRRIGGPATYPAYARLGLACLEKARQSGDTSLIDEGLRHLQTSLAYHRNFDAVLGMAQGLSAQHEFKAAHAFAREAVDTLPHSIPALATLFDIHLARGEVSEAVNVLKQMGSLALSFDTLTRSAALAEYQGNIAAALGLMQAALNLTSNVPSLGQARLWALLALRRLQCVNGRSGEALHSLQEAARINPRDIRVRHARAAWHAAHSEWREAGKLFRRLSKDRPDPSFRLSWAEALHHTGRTNEAAKQRELCIADLRKGLQRHSHDALRLLAMLLVERDSGEDRAEGLRHAQHDYDARPDALAADTLAWACWRNGQSDRALRLSEEALESGTIHPAVLLHGGLIRCGTAQASEGRTLLLQALACPGVFGPLERALAAIAQDEIDRSNPRP